MADDVREESFFFIRVETLCSRPVLTCAPDLEVVQAARLMEEEDASALVVVAGGAPVGMFSVRHLRKSLAAAGAGVAQLKVRDHMRQGLLTIGSRDYVYQAVLKMARHNIFRLGVVDPKGKLVGLITATDLLKLHTTTPLYLFQEIEEARSVEDLHLLGLKMLDLVRIALAAHTDIKGIVLLISGFNDAMAVRLIHLLAEREGIRLPEGAAYLVLGSEGRGEQTLRTDQDNAIVYRDDLPAHKVRQIERFAERLVEGLEAIGVPRCPGNIMASSPLWRRSLSDWKGQLQHWITTPTPENVLNFGMFQDLRPLYGDEGLCRELRQFICTTAQRNAYFFPNMADHVVRFPTPFTLFGRIRVEPGGAYKGKLDLKKAGIFAITAGATLLSLEAGKMGGTTWEKLERLGKQRIFSRGDLKHINSAFGYLVRLRLLRQLQEGSGNEEAARHVDPQAMTDKEREELRQALSGVNTFLWIFRDHYNLDYISI